MCNREGSVSEHEGETSRPWKEIAAELSKEQNPKRALELAKELNAALAAHTPKPSNQPIEQAKRL